MAFRTAEGELWAAPRDDDLSKRSKRFAFDYVGDDLVQNHMQVREGQIVLDSGASYQLLYVIPTPRDTMPLATLSKIRDLARDGATVVWAGRPPKQCPGLTGYPDCDAELRAVAKDLWQSGRLITLPEHDYARLVPILEASPHPPAWQIAGNPPLRFVHRRTPEADVFFVVNRATWPVDVPVGFRIADRRCELWDPDTGEIKPAPCRETEEGVSVPIRLPALGSVFVVFRQRSSPTPTSRDKTRPPEERALAEIAAKPLVIGGPWQLSFPVDHGAPPQITLDRLTSWSDVDDPGVRHFSGIATYRTTFAYPAAADNRDVRATLDIGRVHEVAEVRLNGRLLGIVWHPPYHFDVTGILRPGENHLEIRVANLWHNRLVADASLPPSQRATRMVPETHYTRLRSAPLVPSGLLGPVRIFYAER